MSNYSSNLSHPSKALLSACRALSIQPQSARFSASAPVPLMLFEAGESPANSLDVGSAAALLENIRKGQRLLFTFGVYAGHSMFWISQALPCTGWTSLQQPTIYGPQQPVPMVVTDETFFQGENLAGFAAPLGVDIRPVSAAERGQSRYERYRLQHPYVGSIIAPDSDLWSRPLLNREWTVRICYDNIARLPLLLTGRYGAGRVAMLSTTSAALGDSFQAQAFWRAVMRWLNEPQSASPILTGAKPTLSMSFASPGAVRLTIGNGSGAAMPVQLVTRVLDRNGAMLADGAGELQKRLTLPEGCSTVLDLPLPAPAQPGLPVDEADSCYLVRAGLLSADGSVLLAQQRDASPSPAVRLHVATENLYTAGCSFPGPGPESLDGFNGRMGMEVCAYAYAPGSPVRGTVTLRFGCEDLAPRALVQDLTQPGNVSVVALNDRAAGIRRTPGDHVDGYGTWNGKRGVENMLQFTLPHRSRISAVTLVASYGGAAGGELHNPGLADIELDGRLAATAQDLDTALTKGLGRARIPMPSGSSATTVTVRLPWVNQRGAQQRQEPWIGEIEIEGWSAMEPASARLSGSLTVALVDALTGQRRHVLALTLTLSPGESHVQDLSLTLPPSSGPAIYRLESAFLPDRSGTPVTASAPLMAVLPGKTFKSLQELTGRDVFGTALVVTNGYTKFFTLATGTAEQWGGWGHPDDLIWAYSRQFKEIPPQAKTAANHLYATQTDMRHYSIPWREFSNGQPFFQTATPGLVQYLKMQRGWIAAPFVLMNFGDRWVNGPDLRNCNSWQEYVAFDSYLRDGGGKGLDGRTHGEVEISIHTDHENEWQAWQLGRYVQAVRSFRGSFRAESKDVVIYSQSFPAVAGEAGRELALTIRGMNDDFTWGMQDNSPNLTTGRTLGSLAFNPVWQTSTLMPWGFVSPVFNNWQWHNPVATVEPIRRLLYNRLWRGVVWDGGAYSSIATYAYGNNVGTGFTTTADEYQQWWNLQQRGNLLQPESPLGAGLVISTQKNADSHSTRWNGSDSTALPETRMLMDVFRSLSEAGVSMPFTTNASTLASWAPTSGASLIIVNLWDFNPEELAGLARLHSHGVRIAALATRVSLSPAAVALFSHPGTLLLESPTMGLTHPQAVALASQLINALEIPLSFSIGLAGYGCRCQNLSLIVVEDWLEQARAAKVRLRKAAGARHAAAVNLNNHSTLSVTDSGDFWEITFPVRSADGTMLAVREA